MNSGDIQVLNDSPALKVGNNLVQAQNSDNILRIHHGIYFHHTGG